MEHSDKRVEALLFAASKRISVKEIAELLNEKEEVVLISLEKVKKEYDERDTSLVVIKDDEFWKITLKDEFLDISEKLMPSTELPNHIIETLAVIAWKTPVLQSDLVKWRSPSVYEHISELEKLKLITKIPKGRSYVLKVTDKFYDYFDIPQQKAQEMFDEYKEVEEKIQENAKEFNKGDSFDESEDQREKRLIQEIRENKIDPEQIIKEDMEFLNDFDKRLSELESRDVLAEISLANIEKEDSIENEKEDDEDEKDRN